MPPSLRGWLFALFSQLIISGPASFGGQADDHFAWPPVCRRTFKNPEIVVKKSDVDHCKILYIRPLKKVIVETPQNATNAIAISAVQNYFLEAIWNTYLSTSSLTRNEVELNMEELIPMNRATFLAIGRIRMSGQLTGSALHDAWWNVRMGEELTISKKHLLSLNSIVWAEGTGNQFGHLAIAVRRRGGSADCDYILDFRAPWELDRRSELKDLLTYNLDLIGIRENYYDWLSTQTRYRHCDVTSTFVRVHHEQLLLLEAYSREIHNAGEYRILKGNCGSLGVEVLNRLLPLDRRIPREDSFADLPDKKISLAVPCFGGPVSVVENKSVTLQIGRKIRHRNDSVPAEPSRSKNTCFLKFSRVPEINQLSRPVSATDFPKALRGE